MRLAVSNSSPLILLAKTRALEILTFFYDMIYIPPAVYNEVVEAGIARAYPDALLIKNLLDEGKIIVKSDFQHSLQGLRDSNDTLHPGEVDAIELAVALEGNVILLDDEEARIIARSFNLHVKGTLGLLVDYFNANQIDRDDALKLLNELNKIMYLSADLYNLIESHLKSITLP